MSFSSRGTGSRLRMGAPAIHHSRSSSGSRLVSYSGVKPKASSKKLPRVLPGQSVSFPQTEVLSSSSASHTVEDDDSSSLFHFDFPVNDVMLTPSNSVALSTEEEYWHVLDTIGGTFRLDVSLFVMQDWDEKIGSYWHISRQPRSAEEVAIACTCPSYRAQNMCLHQQVFLSHLDEFLAQATIVDPTSGSLPPAIFLHSTPFNDIYVFSCVSSSSIGRFESGKRVIVTYQRDARFYCHSCRYSPSCKHRQHAVEFAVEAGFVSESLELPSTQDTISNGPSDDEALLASVGSHSDEISSVSYKPIPPPRWCSLPSEPSYTAQYRPAWSSTNTHFDLDVTSCCSCGSSLPQSALSAELHDIVNAVIFGLTIRTDVTVSVYPCILCHHRSRSIGPDLTNYGIFNWNNSLLFTHELLNAYTNAYTASETPFSAFCLTVMRSYEDVSPTMKFCATKTFIQVWFAFVRLQQLDTMMVCPTCGPSPELLIADGVSLATHSSKLTEKVKPPTYTNTATSENIDSISTYKARLLPAISKREIRTIVESFLDTTAKTTQVTDINMENFIVVKQELPALASFMLLLVDESIPKYRRKAYRILIQQIAAPDIVLQLVCIDAIPLLSSFGSSGESVEWLPALCPAVGNIILVHQSDGLEIPMEMRTTVSWLAARAQDVFNRLAQHDPSPPEIFDVVEPFWETGTYYGLPQVRRRRIYSKLKHDASPVDLNTEEMGNCNKFYKTYSRNKLTGGILVLWCTHSICLGFHSIPVAEGRNDVFSAIYTRFPIAPKFVIYDFACQLAPYCLVREARYFQHTRFLIDELHAHDHTRCGQACFASNMMKFDDRIRTVNTSAAECGNKGIKRIRKSVSYMTMEHAAIFTKVFLEVWNRMAIRRMTQNYMIN